MDQNTQEQLIDKVKLEATNAVKQELAKVKTEVETTVTEKYADVLKGMMTQKEFETFKSEQLEKVDSVLVKLDDLETASKEQGSVIKEFVNKSKPGGQKKHIGDFLKDNLESIEKIRSAGTGVIEFSSDDLKAAGVTSIADSIEAMDTPPDSPYLPGIGGALDIYGIIREPNFFVPRTSVGRATRARIAYINEIPMEGSIGREIPESGLKPLIQYKFKVAMSEAVKAAAHIVLTEEFAEDVEDLYAWIRTQMRRDVLSDFDTQVLEFAKNNATPYNFTGIYGIQDPNLWDALYSMQAQVGSRGFTPNAIALGWGTDARMKMEKNINSTYLLPTFASEINDKTVRSNKIAENYALVGDARQVQVRIYKDLVFRLGWINEQHIHNQFTLVAEMRFHRFISDNRKNALVYDNLGNVISVIGGAAPISS